MKKVKVIDLFNVKFDMMESTVNNELKKLQEEGCQVLEVKPIGDSLNKCSIFIIYENK
ncbi:MAG: hypothetical protein KC550_07805 [Nanoarchaeota archaeon]|nr:hypothetical protein [Nanoarchaeota archaeon]